MTSSLSQKLACTLLAVAALLLVAHSLLFNFVTDDAFISFVYSRNLAQHGQLVFNLGERVEGYTNFLWTLILAGLFKVGLQPEIMSRVLGTACAIVTFGVCAFGSRAIRMLDGEPRELSPWDALPGLFLAGISGYACWASGGLETQMFTLFVMLGMTFYLSDAEVRPRSALAFGLSALTRPEGVFFFVLTVAHHAPIHLRQRRILPTAKELRWLLMFALLVVPHFLWRRWYYGYWLPNTFYIKASGGAGTWGQGGYYLSRVVLSYHLWIVPIVCALGLLRKRGRGTSRLYGYALFVVSLFALYVASVGGDFMGLYRFVMPVMPLLMLALSTGLRGLFARAPTTISSLVIAALLCAHLVSGVQLSRAQLAFVGADRGIDSPGFLRLYTADRAAIGKWFGKYAKPDDSAAVGGAGAQVYYSGIRSLDCFGLSDAHIAHDVKPVSNRPGHQKYAPLDYQLSWKPTIITSNYYRIEDAPYRPPAREEAEWRGRGYHFVSVRVDGLSHPWYTFLKRIDRSLGPLPPLTEREP